MRTLNSLFLILAMTTLLMGQIDTTAVDTSAQPKPVTDMEMDEPASGAADSTALPIDPLDRPADELQTLTATDTTALPIDPLDKPADNAQTFMSVDTTALPIDPLDRPADDLQTLLEADSTALPIDPLDKPAGTSQAMASTDNPERKKFLKIRNRQYRTMDALFSNPANLARDFDSKTSWNIVPDFSINIHNSLLTPGWYKEWWTTGGTWDQATKNDYLSTIADQKLALSVAPEFQTLFGFRIGRYGFNSSLTSHFTMVLPGNMLGLPMQDISFDEPIDNSGLEIEAVPIVTKSSLSYAHPLSTPYGDLKIGANLNIYNVAGYARMVSNDFTIVMTQDSIEAHATGEAWGTLGGASGVFEGEEDYEFEISDQLSDISMGIDLGLILDLKDYLDQDVEVQLMLKNIGASYKWSNVTHETWSYDLSMPIMMDDGDSLEQYENLVSTVVGTDEALIVKVPTVLSVSALYQPFQKLLVGAGIEKAFTDELRLGYSPDLGFSLQLNYYPVSWFDISYYMIPRFGDPAHTFGSGLHFGFLDTGFTLSFINGFNSNAKGIGFGFHSSLHF